MVKYFLRWSNILWDAQNADWDGQNAVRDGQNAVWNGQNAALCEVVKMLREIGKIPCEIMRMNRIVIFVALSAMLFLV